MKRLSITILLTLLFFGSNAQNKEAMKKIESARIALITERLGLSPDQAEKFWPVYREYNLKKKALRQQWRTERKNVDIETLTEEQGKELMRKSMELKEKQLNLEKQYSTRMNDVISTKQLYKLKNAETDFQQMLIKRIQQQRQRQDQNQKMMQRREMMKDRNNN